VFVGVLAGASLLFALALLPSVGAAGKAFQRFTTQFNAIGTESSLQFPRFPERSQVYAADGSLLATLFFDENRKYAKIKDIAPVARRAVLAIEDANFYEHQGVDTLAVVRAALKNLVAGGIEQGASTVTQQLARNAFPSVGTERTLARKVIEARVAMLIEQKYSKNQILELYLNRVYYGRGTYGMGTAAEFYFSKKATELTLPEAAMLAGLIASPEKFNPVKDMNAATERRNQVLHRMAVLGWVKDEVAEQAMAEPIELKLKPPTKVKAPFFVDFIKRRVLEDRRFGKTREQRNQVLFQGGLQIHTTLEPKLERFGLRVIENHLPLKEDPEAAIASLDARTGAIKALVSSTKFKRSQVNYATGEGGTGRQIGSSFKVITLVAAFEQGIPQMKVYDGTSGKPVDCGPGHAPYRVQNADGGGGHMNLWAATKGSVNAVFVRLSVDAGLPKVIEVGHRMGINSELREVCSLTLGVNEVNPLEMASVFQTLANQGKRCEPYAIAKVIGPTGETEFKQDKSNCKQVIDRKIAILVVNMLKQVVAGGTGTAANLSAWPEFGKTGYTNYLKDATFGGCTRQICSFAWVGHAKKLIAMSNVHGRRVFGGTFPAMIWHDFMEEAMKGKKVLDWPPAPPPGSATVPDVLGKTEKEAVKILSEAGFSPQVKPVPSLDVEPGKVARQNPPGGSKATAGSQVMVGISNGKAPKGKIPDVRGLSEKEATKRLKKAGFVVSVKDKPAAGPEQDGTVESQSPGSGTKAKEGSTVTITVWRYTEPSPSPSPSP
jgi:membrane peptidoglycan carboxypeptidase